MNERIIFYGILRLILSKKTTNINFTGKNIFFFLVFWQNWYLYHHCRFNFIQQYSVNRNSNYHFIYLPFGVNCKMFLYLCRISYVFLVWWYINQTPINIVTAVLNKLRVPIHNSVNRLWIFNVSWNPKTISIIVLVSVYSAIYCNFMLPSYLEA